MPGGNTSLTVSDMEDEDLDDFFSQHGFEYVDVSNREEPKSSSSLNSGTVHPSLPMSVDSNSDLEII